MNMSNDKQLSKEQYIERITEMMDNLSVDDLENIYYLVMRKYIKC